MLHLCSADSSGGYCTDGHWSLQQTTLLYLQVLSDIHLEFRNGRAYDFPVTASDLCLLGDIGDPSMATYRDFLHCQAARYDHVFLLKGNHSCYGRSVEEADDLIGKICARHPTKLHYLNKTAVDLDHHYVILGCTLWSHVINRQRLMVLSMLADNHHITYGQSHATTRCMQLSWSGCSLQLPMSKQQGRRLLC